MERHEFYSRGGGADSHKHDPAPRDTEQSLRAGVTEASADSFYR